MNVMRFLKYSAYILALCAVLTQAVSCVKDDSGIVAGVYSGERLQMQIRLGDVNATADDATITTVRVIVFNDKGQLIYNDTKTATLSGGVYSAVAEAAPGINNFYIICNETPELTEKLAGMTSEPQIENIGFSAVGIAPPLPMYGKVMRGYVRANSDGTEAKVTVNNVTKDHLEVAVNRMVARLSFTAIKNITDETDFTVTELRIKVCRMPVSTTIGENRNYEAAVWADDLTVTGTGTLDNNGAYTVNGDEYTVPEEVNSITFPDIYIPEHLLETPADASQATYLKIDAKCRMKDGTVQTINSVYLLNIGQNPPQNHNILRNNHYSIYATITGMGAMGLYAEIVEMKEHEITVNWKPIEGLVIVSDKTDDYDFAADTMRNINVWNDYNVFSGILKVYNNQTGYKDVLFKYGSLIAVYNDRKAATEEEFVAPTDVTALGDILWYPASYGNPAGKIKDWAGIPFVSSGDIPNNTDVVAGKGDPCKLVGLSEVQINQGIFDNGQWHMATPDEYAILMAAADNETTAGYNDHGYRSFHAVMLPNAKYRNESGVLSATTGGGGKYWTTTGTSAFGFTNTVPASASVAVENPQNGYTVRCVRNTIPESYMIVGESPVFSYQGNTTTGVPLRVVSNIPFGKATLITSGPDVGSSKDFDDFSFEPGDTRVHTVTGRYSQDVPVYIKRWENKQSRTFKIKVEGMGYDGKTVSQIITAAQSGYTIYGRLSLDSPEMIPKAGGTYRVTANFTPTDIAMPAGELSIQVTYLRKVIATSPAVQRTEPSKYSYPGFEITIPPNTTPDVIGISIEILYTYDSGYVQHLGTTGKLQDNK